MDNVEGKRSEGTEAESALQVVYMWGYLPGALPQRAPLLTPVTVRFPASGCSWKDVCGGGCGFAMAISGALSFNNSHAVLFVCYFFVVAFDLRTFCFKKIGLDLRIKQVLESF